MALLRFYLLLNYTNIKMHAYLDSMWLFSPSFNIAGKLPRVKEQKMKKNNAQKLLLILNLVAY